MMGPALPLVQELSSAEAPLATPTHELQAEGDALLTLALALALTLALTLVLALALTLTLTLTLPLTLTHEPQAEGDALRLCVQLPRRSELHKSCRAEPVLLSRGAAHSFPWSPRWPGARGSGCASQRPGPGGRRGQRGGTARP